MESRGYPHLDKNYLRYVLAPRRLKQEERHELYRGIPKRNKVVLLEPRDPQFNLDNHRDLLKWAQRQLAAQELAGTTSDSGRRANYERIAREDKGHCIDTIKRAGLAYIRWENYGLSAKEDRVEGETVPGTTKEDVHKYLSQQLFPAQLFEEHLSRRLTDIMNLSVKDIDQEYCSTMGFPVPTTVRSVGQAIRELCRGGQIGIRHPRGNFCQENPSLTETELFEAKVGEPFEAPPRPAIFPPTREPGEIPPPGGEEGPTITPPPILPEKRQEISISPQTGAGELRQSIGAKLQEFHDPRITRIRATIFLEKSTGDLSSLPASIRGNLSGEGTVTAEIAVTKDGQFSKSDVEQIVESLPSLPGADYAARLDVLVPSPAGETDDE